MTESMHLRQSLLPTQSRMRTHEALAGSARQLVARVVEPAAERLVDIENGLGRAIQDHDAVGGLLHERPEQPERVPAKSSFVVTESLSTVA